MTPVEERLSALLHVAAPDATGVSSDALPRGVGRRRQAVLAGTAALIGAMVAALVVVAAALPGSGRGDRVTTGPTPASTSTPSTRIVTFQGVTFALPDGWTVAQPHCGPPADHTVVLGIWGGSCPGGTSRDAQATAVSLTALYGPQFALTWPGRRTTRQGQPAWRGTETTRSVTTATLALPWANAFVTAQSADASVARGLLDRVSVQQVGSLAVPADATSVLVQSLAGHDGDGQQRNKSVTDTAAVHQLLADLRALTPVTSPARACDGTWWPSTALLTVHGGDEERTYAARFGACSLVIAGTASAARTSDQLLSDIRRLVPNSGM